MEHVKEIVDTHLPSVALVGRVNVGKSTIFNKLIAEEKALVSKIAGTTRTRNMGVVNWRGKNFNLIDTGGLTFSEDVILEDEIIKQTKMALKQADLIYFVVDIQSGILPQEKELAKMLHKYIDKIVLVANKADSNKWMNSVNDHEFMQLGLGEPLPVSAANGANLGDLLDLTFTRLNKLPKRPKQIKEVETIKVALMGKPNVGKSTLFNAIVGRDEVVVSDMAHTTREPFDTLLNYNNNNILFVDTAGIRRKTKVKGDLELQGVLKSIKMIKKSDIVLLLLDTSEAITSQDKQLGGLLKESSRSVIVLVNKWDLSEDNSDQFRNTVRKLIYNEFPHLKFAPLVFISAKSKYRVHTVFDEILKANAGRQILIDDKTLDKFREKVVREHLPSRGKGVNYPKILALKQLATNPPVFEIRVKAKTSLHPSYLRYLKNKLREEYGFYATPIIMKIKKRKK